MTEKSTVITSINEVPPRVSEFHRIVRIFLGRRVVIFGLIVILITVLTAIFAPLLAPFDPNKTNMESILLQPNWEHLLGTDAAGRDTLSRVIYGARVSLLVGVMTIIIASVIGMSLGLVAGYFGGLTNAIVMRFIDSIMAYPMILLALVIASVLGGGLKNVIIALGIALVSVYARLMCGQVLAVKVSDYVLAERAMGSGTMRIMLRHILPNCFPPLIVLVTLMMGAAILAEAGLSYIGIGVAAPTAAWGSMVNDGYKYLLSNPILSFAPGLAIMLVVFSFNMVGDGLRDALDPRLRGLI